MEALAAKDTEMADLKLKLKNEAEKTRLTMQEQVDSRDTQIKSKSILKLNFNRAQPVDPSDGGQNPGAGANNPSQL